jgi:hypothetical protein
MYARGSHGDARARHFVKARTRPSLLAMETASAVMRAVAATLLACSLFVLFRGERAVATHDLQLAVQAHAQPGEELALRAFVVRDAKVGGPPPIASQPLQVRLLDAEGNERARSELRPGADASLEGSLRVPQLAAGRYRLEAVGDFAGTRLGCERPLDVTTSTQRALHGAGALPPVSLSDVRVAGKQTAPEPFSPRIAGGVCVREQPCSMLVWVGEPASSVIARESALVQRMAPSSPPNETDALVEIPLRVRAERAETTLEARRRGELVAERVVRLPTGADEVGVSTSAVIVDRGARVTLSVLLPPDAKSAILDVFAQGGWHATRGVLRTTASVVLDTRQWPYGIVRVQARRSALATQSSGGRVLYVRSPGETDGLALRALAIAVGALTGEQELSARWAREIPPWTLLDAQRAAAYAAAPLEAQRVALPAPVSGRGWQTRSFQHTRAWLRGVVAALWICAALLLRASWGRRRTNSANANSTALES